MQRIIRARGCAFALALALAAQAALPFAAHAKAAGDTVKIPDGLEFTIETTEDTSSKTATEGDPVTFKVSEDVKVGDQIVIAKGTVVKGQVTNSQKSGRLGKGGQLSIRIESTTAVDGQKIKLRASKGKEGNDATGATVALTVLFGPLGLLKKGKEATIKAGTKIKVYTDEEKQITING